MRHRGRGIGILVALVALVAMVALALGAAPGPASAASGAGQPTLAAQIGDTPTGQAMAPGFVGVSFEYRAMHVYTGRDPGHVNPVLVSLLRALAPGQAPVLRIGGNSTDHTWWPLRGVIPPGGIDYSLTKGWLRTTRALAAALGAQLIMGVNLAAGRPALAGAEARAILEGIGRRYVRALEVGNEPDLYGAFPWYRERRGLIVLARSPQYDIAAYASDFSRWRAALPSIPLAAPAFSGLQWLSGLDGLLSTERGLGLVTFHRYPLRACETNPSSPSYASIPNLLTDGASLGLAQGVAPFVQVAHAHGLAFRLDELNSAACSGRRGVSDTFASALWMLDALFNMAAVGVDGVNVHTLPGAPYEPFTFTHQGSQWRAFVRPDYYAMLMFAQAFPPRAKLLAVNAPSGPIKIWATQGADGHTRIVLINRDPATSVVVQLQLPGPQSALSAQLLTAPGLTATSGVSLAGQTFGTSTDTGTLPGPPQLVTVRSVLGAPYSVDLPAGSAVLLTR